MKLVLAALGLLAASPVLAKADMVSFATGEQLAGIQGTTVEAALSFGPIKFVPWALIDGGRFEGMAMVQFGGTPDSLVIGLLVGSSYDRVRGSTPYFGGEIRGKLKLPYMMFLFRLAERNTKEGLLARFANIGLEAGPPELLVRLAYQPIERNRVVTHRLALKATIAYRRNIKVGVEVRQYLDGSNRKGALAEVSIPLQ